MTNDYGHLDPPLFSRLVGPSGRCTLFDMSAAVTIKPQPVATFLVIAVHPDDECYFVRIHVEAISRHDARVKARAVLRGQQRDSWLIEGITMVEYD